MSTAGMHGVSGPDRGTRMPGRPDTSRPVTASSRETSEEKSDLVHAVYAVYAVYARIVVEGPHCVGVTAYLSSSDDSSVSQQTSALMLATRRAAR